MVNARVGVVVCRSSVINSCKCKSCEVLSFAAFQLDQNPFTAYRSQSSVLPQDLNPGSQGSCTVPSPRLCSFSVCTCIQGCTALSQIAGLSQDTSSRLLWLCPADYQRSKHFPASNNHRNNRVGFSRNLPNPQPPYRNTS